jgi:hypothetical protein
MPSFLVHTSWLPSCSVFAYAPETERPPLQRQELEAWNDWICIDLYWKSSQLDRVCFVFFALLGFGFGELTFEDWLEVVSATCLFFFVFVFLLANWEVTFLWLDCVSLGQLSALALKKCKCHSPQYRRILNWRGGKTRCYKSQSASPIRIFVKIAEILGNWANESPNLLSTLSRLRLHRISQRLPRDINATLPSRLCRLE